MVTVKVTVCPTAAGFGDAVIVSVVTTGPLIVCVTAVDVDAANVAFPEYTAVMLCDPELSAAVVNVATPEALTVPVPSSVAPS
jgi:hypothetical protein